MHSKPALLLSLLLIAAALAAGLFAIGFNLSALPAPGSFETYLAAGIKEWFVYRESRAAELHESPATSDSATIGQMIFESECSYCHGSDGRTPTDIGQGLYPRAPDLGTAEVQGFSDRELFWIIRNGIRLSGMPSFGKQLSNQETWELVRYVRSLGTVERNAK